MISEGQAIRYRHPFSTVEWAAWIVKVHNFVNKDMAPQAMTKFQHITGIEGDLSISSFSARECRVLDRQIQNLLDIMEKIEVYL